MLLAGASGLVGSQVLERLLSQASGLAYTVVNGAAGALALSEEQF